MDVSGEMMGRAVYAFLAGMLASAVAGDACSQDALPRSVDPGQTRPVSLAKIVPAIPAGTTWAHLSDDDVLYGCREVQVLTWEGKSNSPLADGEFERIFRDQLGQFGFRTAGDPTNLFEQDQKSAELQIGARITGLDAAFCSTQSWRDRIRESERLLVKGSATMVIEWQVYSTLEARIVARIPTTGSYQTTKGLDAGDVVILQRAFADNVMKLATADAFRQALVAPPPRPASTTPAQSLTFRPAPSGARRAMADVGASVAVVVAGVGSGSAFLVSTDGYLITNSHVVGDASRVKLRWPDKSEGIGEVVRLDRRRDVALVKTEPRGRAPLVLRSAPPQAGDTVFAIGTPLSDDFQNTVTRGTVSANRVYEGQTFIQSDVAVDHGNSGGPLLDEGGRVLGITQWSYAPDGVSHNLNFFIPIQDALRALSLKPAG